MVEWGKWMIVVAAIWIQAFTGTNLDFSSYSSHLKAVLGISQLQLNYLSVASDFGKALGWCSGLFLLYLPLGAVLFIAALLGFFGYVLQWLLIRGTISLPYSLVFLLCLLGGCSICWFNTVCLVLCIRSFRTNTALALSLTISFNGLTAALYTLIANAIDPNDDTLYLFLNAVIPLLTSVAALAAILHQPPPQPVPTSAVLRRDSFIFLCLYIVAFITGLYLLFLNFLSSNAVRARILLVGAIFLLILPLCLPGIAYARDWTHHNINFFSRSIDPEELELKRKLIESDGDVNHLNGITKELMESDSNNLNGMTCISHGVNEYKESCFGKVIEKDMLRVLGEEHPARVLVGRWDFWLYYVTYLCGGTIGLVYSNNLGQISQSLGYSSQTSSLVTLYSSCSFFGRLLSAAPDFLRDKVYFPRTGWLAMAIVPTPIALFLLAGWGNEAVLRIGTALIGVSSGFVFSAAVSITSELFGANSAGINHNILITNIPIGSLLYGILAAVVYDSNQGMSNEMSSLQEATLCIGRKCFKETFLWWGCFSIMGLASSFLLFIRTRHCYDRRQLAF
ncbi:protein NUCLEAR FUSION DEFECTIVE 4-like [Humulus lupulus]|uniref:protein NUCLEAR FUSION DEFECTIVE 4-like n=1 Tax=Humulus lupulus TaxID=3486 RepID=UPI002B409814|nr:protein NUCLEAR FUSION DEFECTIVE 4-like [Humulus lupulus]